MRHGRHVAALKVGHNLGARSGRFVREIGIRFTALASPSSLPILRKPHARRDEALSHGIREVVRSNITTKQQISGYFDNVKGTVTTKLTQQNCI